MSTNAKGIPAAINATEYDHVTVIRGMAHHIVRSLFNHSKRVIIKLGQQSKSKMYFY